MTDTERELADACVDMIYAIRVFDIEDDATRAATARMKAALEGAGVAVPPEVVGLVEGWDVPRDPAKVPV